MNAKPAPVPVESVETADSIATDYHLTRDDARRMLRNQPPGTRFAIRGYGDAPKGDAVYSRVAYLSVSVSRGVALHTVADWLSDNRENEGFRVCVHVYESKRDRVSTPTGRARRPYRCVYVG